MDERTWLAARSAEFRALHDAIGGLVRARWPAARVELIYPGEAYEMAAWLVPVPDHPPKESWKGTMPNDTFVVGPTQTKSGMTIHVWHPNQPGLLKDNAHWLAAAGFKPMVGCLQWNRKAPVDLEAFGRLLDAV